MTKIRSVKSVYSKLNTQGLKQTVIEYNAHNGNHGTKIITELDKAGNKSIRDIERDNVGTPRRVIDELYGKKEIYVPAFSEHQQGVFLYSEDNVKTYFPNIVFSDLCKY